MLSCLVFLVAFSDRSQNTSAQDIKRTAVPLKTPKANVDSIRVVQFQDSLKLELEKAKEIVQQTEAITEESKQLTEDLLINKGKHIEVKNLAVQTLKVAVYKQQKAPMIFVVAPKKKEPTLPVNIKPVYEKDSLVTPVVKRKFLKKIGDIFRKDK